MDRGLACWVAGLLVVAAVAAPAAGAGAPDGPLGVAQEEFDPDDVTLSAALDEDGSAAWSFNYRMELATENETEAFEELQADVDANRSSYVDRFRARIASTVASAENATGRNMSVENVSVETRLQSGGEFSESYGFVEYTFEWEGFASTDGDRVVAGDALEGFYLNEQTSLQLSWPDGYAAVDTDPPADDSTATSVRWSGPEEFGVDQPRVVVAPADPAGTAEEPTETTVASGGESSVVLPALVGALVAVLVLAVAGWLYVRRGGDGLPSAPTSGGTGGGGAASEPDPAPDAEESDAAAGAASEPDPPAELLSNEERVQKFLREQGGRAKQQAVVEAMGWTEAKTSQVVKDMRENGELESFRIGRENVLKLPDADVDEESASE
ncbi:helix-turn-helix transcriptional regulator [Halobacterium hubeiense]|uniref:helix-turn-helix transcriptional regulator n=1 Tax=Halobacterium hubeiense TaxID=1407499 RepID=UPI003C707B80